MESNHFLEYIAAQLRAKLGVSVVVTRNVNRSVNSRHLPMVFVIEGADKVLDRTSGPIVKRTLDVTIQSVIRGSTEGKAKSELAEFQQEVRKALMGENINRTVGTTYRGTMHELHASEIECASDASPNIVVQTIYFEILYLQDLLRMFS